MVGEFENLDLGGTRTFSGTGTPLTFGVEALVLTESNLFSSMKPLLLSSCTLLFRFAKSLFFLGARSSSELTCPSGKCLLRSMISDLVMAVSRVLGVAGAFGSKRLMNVKTGSSGAFMRASIWNSSELASVVGGVKGGTSSLDGGVTFDVLILMLASVGLVSSGVTVGIGR